MGKVLLIGASGSIGEVVAPEILQRTDKDLVLAGRHPNYINVTDPDREEVISLDVTNDAQLEQALVGVDFVFASLTGKMDKYAAHLVKALEKAGVKRLAFITTMGIYQEIPAWLGDSPDPYRNSILKPFRKAADIIEDSSLDYTILRPGWLDYSNDTNYELTKKGEPFGGHDVSRKSIADLVVRLIQDPEFGKRESFGINRPQAH